MGGRGRVTTTVLVSSADRTVLRFDSMTAALAAAVRLVDDAPGIAVGLAVGELTGDGDESVGTARDLAVLLAERARHRGGRARSSPRADRCARSRRRRAGLPRGSAVGRRPGPSDGPAEPVDAVELSPSPVVTPRATARSRSRCRCRRCWASTAASRSSVATRPGTRLTEAWTAVSAAGRGPPGRAGGRRGRIGQDPPGHRAGPPGPPERRRGPARRRAASSRPCPTSRSPSRSTSSCRRSTARPTTGCCGSGATTSPASSPGASPGLRSRVGNLRAISGPSGSSCSTRW